MLYPVVYYWYGSISFGIDRNSYIRRISISGHRNEFIIDKKFNSAKFFQLVV
jgi:hypothetical protein